MADLDRMLKSIVAEGSRLLKAQLDEGEPLAVTPSWDWLPTLKLWRFSQRKTFLKLCSLSLILVPVTVVCDGVSYAAVHIAWLAKGARHQFLCLPKWRYRCPFCFSALNEYFAKCECGHIQSSLAPANGEFGARHCRKCGNRVSTAKANRVCRRTSEFTGCRRTLPIDVPWGRHPEVHVMLFGAGAVWKKLAVLAHVWRHLGSTPDPTLRSEPCWKLTYDESRYLSAALRQNPSQLAERVNRAVYTVSKSAVFLMGSGRNSRIVQFHNLPKRNGHSNGDELHQSLYLNPGSAATKKDADTNEPRFVFVFDSEALSLGYPALAPHADELTRLIRSYEHHRANAWKTGLLGRFAVVVPGRAAAAADIERYVRRVDPQFWGLLKTVVRRVQYFGGPIDTATTPHWVEELNAYLFA